MNALNLDGLHRPILAATGHLAVGCIKPNRRRSRCLLRTPTDGVFFLVCVLTA